MSEIKWPFVLLFLGSVFVASVSQVLLKIAAQRPHKSIIAEYTDWHVLLGYTLFFGCTLLTLLAYRGVPLSLGPVLETTGYLYVTAFGILIFHERVSPRKWLALGVIVAGILLYAL